MTETNNEQGLQVKVRGISFKATKQDIEDFFKSFTTFKSVNLIVNPQNGKSKGIAYVQLDSQESFDKALNKNKTEHMGRALLIEVAGPKKQKVYSVQESNQIFVGNLNLDITVEKLKAEFNQFGTIVNAKVILNKYALQPKAFGFIEFETLEQSKQAFTKNGQVFEGLNLKVDFQYNKPQLKTRKRSNNRRGPKLSQDNVQQDGQVKEKKPKTQDGEKREGNNRDQRRNQPRRRQRNDQERNQNGERSTQQRREQRQDNNDEKKTQVFNDKSVYVANLSYKTDSNSLQEIFQQQCGEVVNVKIATYYNSQKSKGFGFVEFASAESAQKAIKLTGDSIDGREIRVELQKAQTNENKARRSRPPRRYNKQRQQNNNNVERKIVEKKVEEKKE